MRCHARSLRNDASGAAAIEFAITIVPLVTLLFGGITYGGVLASMISLEHAANEGARAGLAGLTICERESRAESFARQALAFGPLAGFAVIDATVSEQEIQLDITFDYAAHPISPVFFPVPEQLRTRVVVLTDGPEISVQSC